MTKNTTETNQADSANASGKRTSLDGQYRNIGISAVAAALPYVGKAKSATQKSSGNGHADGRKRSVLAL